MNAKMTNREIITAINRIVAMQDRETETKEKIFGDRIRVMYAIKKNKAKLERLLKPYNEARAELLEECNKPDAQLHDQIDIREDCLAKWNKGINELLDIEVDVDVHTIKLSDLDGLSLLQNDIEAIFFMIDDPDDEPENAE